MAVFGGNKSIVGLDIGSASVKAVELTRSGQSLVITGRGSVEIESPEMVGEAIQQVLQESGIRAKRCVTSVSGRSVIIRQVPMMEMPDSELRQAVEYEADKYIPFDVAEVQLDAQRLREGENGEGADGQMKVLLVAVKKTLIEEHVALLQSAGLTPVIVDVDVFALGNAFELRNLSLGIDDNEVRALVDLGASKTNINIMRGGASFFQREIYVAGNDLTDAVAKRFGEDPKDVEKMKMDPGGALESMQDAMLPVLEDIGSEIRLSFDYFENQYDQQVKEVYISGGSSLFPGMDTMLTQVFNLPTKIWDPMEGLQVANYGTGLSGANSDMVVALGLSSRILGTMGLTTRVVQPTGPAPSVLETGVQPVAPMAAPGGVELTVPTDVSKKWITGLGLAAVLALAIAAVLAFTNETGYAKMWAILEGLPIGLAIGVGLWTGLKSLRPLPGRISIVFASASLALLTCGLLLFGRHAMGVPLVPEPPPPRLQKAPEVPIPESAMDNPLANVPGISKKEMAAAKAFRAKFKHTKRLDVDDISAFIFIFAQWCIASFAATFLVARQFQKAEQAAPI